MELLNFLEYSFVQKAFIAGIFIALTCSSLGLFLVLRKMSLIGDGLSHASLGAIALGLFLGIYPFYIALPIIVIMSILILKISEKTKIYGDSIIGMISAFGISVGIILASISNGFNVDLFSYLFGNILSINNNEVILSIILSLIVLIIIYLFYWDLFSVTFDEEYAKTTGIKTNNINTLLAILTGITVALSIKIVGIMLISALLIVPAITALQFNQSFKKTFLIANIISVLSLLLGIIISFLLDLPTGATIVMVNIIFFSISFLIKKK